MQRKMRRAVSHLSLFCCILFLLIYLNRPRSNKPFTWTPIRYRPRTSELPERRGTCPGLTDTSKPALVVSRIAADGDIGWLDALTHIYHLCVYTADSPFIDAGSSQLQVPANRGHEAMGYVSDIHDRQLPAYSCSGRCVRAQLAVRLAQ